MARGAVPRRGNAGAIRWLATAVLALAGCQPMAQKPPAFPYPAQRVYQSAYSFMPPNEPGWVTMGRNAHQLVFAKPGINTDESFAIHGRAFRVPAYGSKEQFVEIIKKGLDEQAADPRYKVLKHEMITDAATQTSCLRSHFVAEDHKAVKRTATPGILVIEVMTRSCAHPKNPRVVVELVCSHRRYPEHADARFAEKADAFLSSIEFLE